jgi:cyanobactin maturation PatA/PatG family protease
MVAHATPDAESVVTAVSPNALAPPGPPADTSTAVTASHASAGCGCGGTGSTCTCGTAARPALVYALGELGYDFGTQARRDSFIQAGLANPDDATQALAFLTSNPAFASALIWTLSQDATPIYAVLPAGPFAAQSYERLREFLNDQLTAAVERVSVPGVTAGTAALLSGQVVPLIVPEFRGLYSWSSRRLVEAVAGAPPKAKDAEGLKAHEKKSQDIGNFLQRVYYEFRNLGLAPQERAMNYAGTNAFQAERVFEMAIASELVLDSIDVDRSPICRPGSDCWDVKLTFFNPSRRLEHARRVYRFTVDVSDVVPVTVGKVRHWDMY